MEHVDLHRTPRRRRSPLDAREAASVYRLPPHSLDAEQGILGCLLLNPAETLPQCVTLLYAGIEMFYDLRHQEIYRAILELDEAKSGIDVITLMEHLKRMGQFEAVGGMDYFAPLPDKVASSTNLEFYAGIVKEKYLRRQTIRTCMDIASRCYEEDTKPADLLLDESERDILAIRQGLLTSASHKPIKEIVHSTINRMEEYHANQGKLMGLATGFLDLDKLTMGLRGNTVFIIAARPSLGKTSLAMNMAEAVALDQKLPVGVFSLEMSSENLVERMVSSRGRVNLRNLREGLFSERDFPKITSVSGKIAQAPLYIDDSSGLSILQLRAKARRMWQQYGIKLFVIDYLQLLHSTNPQARNSREREVADISKGIKELSKELDVPVIVLAQLNRDLEKLKNKKPNLSHLRESGAIEQDGDIIGLLSKVQGADDDEDNVREQESTLMNLDIAKHRNGPTCNINLCFLKSFTRFESAAKISADDIPSQDHPLLPNTDNP